MNRRKGKRVTGRRTALALLTMLLVAGCSGVPRSSQPQVVQSVRAGVATAQVNDNGPQPGTGPLNIVREFLGQAIRSTSSARQYLTVDAQRRWQPSPVVIVQNFEGLSPTVSGDSASVVITAPTRVGQIDKTGVFTPTLKSTQAADAPTIMYGLKRVDGQWRIDDPPLGALMEQATFQTEFPHSWPLYFYDSSYTKLIPDPRYSALQGTELVSWLLDQLLVGPRPELASAVNPVLPDEPDPQRVTVTFGNPVKIELPGVSQSDPADRQKLAAQLAYTFGINTPIGSELQLTDGGKPVSVSADIGDTFTATDFPSQDPDSAQTPGAAYNLVRGQLLSAATQAPVAKGTGLGAPGLGLTTVAVRGTVAAGLQVVAVAGARLFLGQEQTGYVPIPLAGTPAAGGQPGLFSQPDWEPGTNRAWIGVGSSAGIYLVGIKSLTAVNVNPIAGGAAPIGQITSLTFSPDAARIAAVISTAAGSALWVGSVVRSGQGVRVDGFEPITPAGENVLDAAWRDTTNLVATVQDVTRAQIISIGSDGSAGGRPVSTAGLNGQPHDIVADSGEMIASVPGSPSADGFLYQRSGDSDWQALVGDSTNGASPVFSRPN